MTENRSIHGHDRPDCQACHPNEAQEAARKVGTFAEGYAEGLATARDEIARALEHHSRQYANTSQANTALALAAVKIRDGSIREWLPKENG